MSTLGTEDGVWGTLLCPRERVLDVAGRRCLDTARDLASLQRDAETAWSLLSSEVALADMEWCSRPVALRPFAGASATTLRDNALRAFAAALVAGPLLRPAEPGDLTALETWLGRFADPSGESARPGIALGRLPWDDSVGRVGALLNLLPPAVGMHLRLHLLHYMPDTFPVAPAESARAVRVCFPTYDDLNGGGGVFELELSTSGSGDRGLYQHPACGSVPLADDWLGILARAHGRHQFLSPVVWNLRRLKEAGVGTRTVSGQSHTAAVCVGFRALAEGRDVDPGCVISAWFGESEAAWVVENPNLKRVDGLDSKCKAVCGLVRFDRLLFNDPAFCPGRTEFTHGRAISLVRPATLEDAYQDATGLLADLREFYRRATAFIDRDLPVYLGRRLLSELYIEPDVLRDVIHTVREPAKREAGNAEPGGPENDPANDEDDGRVKLEAATEAEEKYRDKEVTQRERAARRALWPNTRRAVIIGDPGEGETVLAKHLLRELATRSLRELDAGETPIAQVTAPVFLRLADLAESDTLDEAIRAGITRMTGAGRAFSEALVRHLVTAIRGGNGTIILDGLDEVATARLPVIRRHLETLDPLPCRVVLTSRPYGYQRGGVPFAQLDQFELAPLDANQRRAFVEEWFCESQRPDWQARVQELVAGPAMGTMSQNAFLLTLICAEAEIRELPLNARRPHLYFWIVRDLIRGAWRQVPPPVDENDPGLDVQIRRLRRVCWELLSRHRPGMRSHGTSGSMHWNEPGAIWIGPARPCAIGRRGAY
jgi:hypothetical protein